MNKWINNKILEVNHWPVTKLQIWADRPICRSQDILLRRIFLQFQLQKIEGTGWRMPIPVECFQLPACLCAHIPELECCRNGDGMIMHPFEGDKCWMRLQVWVWASALKEYGWANVRIPSFESYYYLFWQYVWGWATTGKPIYLIDFILYMQYTLHITALHIIKYFYSETAFSLNYGYTLIIC